MSDYEDLGGIFADLIHEAFRSVIGAEPVILSVGASCADPSSKRQKADSGPDAWLPSNKPYRCAYVSHIVRVLDKYDLAINAADKTAVERVLVGCPK